MDMNTFGLLFESLVIRDLRVYVEAQGGKAYHYRDSDGLEADAIMHLKGRWAAAEVKLGSSEGVEEGVRNLKRLREKVNDTYRNKLVFLVVITAHGYAYRRDDGVYVVPIGCLRP